MRVASPVGGEEGQALGPGISMLPTKKRARRATPQETQAVPAEEVSSRVPGTRVVKGPPTTPARTLYDILQETGWAEKKSDFSRVLDVRQKNAYMYLDEGTSRIKASAETIFAWIRSIQRNTGLSIEVTLLGDGRIRFDYFGHTGAVVPGLAKDEPVPPTERYAQEPAWMDEARKGRALARRKGHAPRARASAAAAKRKK